MSPEQYLEQIRTNINDFIDTDISRFGPYDDLPGEWNRWTSSNPLGTVLTIDFFGPGPLNLQNGSVVSIVNTSDQWVFGTVYTPNDGYHPVSGNRQFGVRTNDNGTATFYTRGVDRISTDAMRAGNFVADLFGPSGFEQADALWTSLFEEGIAEDLGLPGPSGVAFDSTLYRTDYDAVQDLVDGDPNNDAAALNALGCE
jgi:hypothetical protein